MFDKFGRVIDDFLIDTDGNGLYWAFFWLKGIHAKEIEPSRRKGKLVGRAAAAAVNAN